MKRNNDNGLLKLLGIIILIVGVISAVAAIIARWDELCEIFPVLSKLNLKAKDNFDPEYDDFDDYDDFADM